MRQRHLRKERFSETQVESGSLKRRLQETIFLKTNYFFVFLQFDRGVIFSLKRVEAGQV